MGDGVLVYFGYPQAHEDDAERAVRAGLALVKSIGQLNTAGGEPLNARVGIATGLVVVGDLIGSGEAQERGIAGETPNLAARLQELAESGAVIIADGTRRLLGDLFELSGLALSPLKGFAEPVRAWRVLGEGRAESRFEALHGTRLTPLVGRGEELELVLSRWRQAKEDSGQVALISGEPGIGKSRLVLALRERLQGEPKASVSYACSPHHVHSALFPFVAQLERSAGFSPDDSWEARLNRLESLLRETVAEPGDAAGALCRCCSAFRSVTRERHRSDVAAAEERASLPDISRAARGAGGARPGAHGARRCALARPDVARALRSNRRSHSAPAGAPCRDVPA